MSLHTSQSFEPKETKRKILKVLPSDRVKPREPLKDIDWSSRLTSTQHKGELFELPDNDIRFQFEAKAAELNAHDIAPGPDGNLPMPTHFANRFAHAPRHILEPSLGLVDDKMWNDWRWHQRKRYRRIE